MAGWNHNWNKFPPGVARGRNAAKVDRAKEIKVLLGRGMTGDQIADALGMTASNVRTYIMKYNLRAPNVFVDKKK